MTDSSHRCDEDMALERFRGVCKLGFSLMGVCLTTDTFTNVMLDTQHSRMDGGDGTNGSNVLQEHQQHATHQHMHLAHPQAPGVHQQAPNPTQQFMQQGHRVS